ncbi:DUF2976 domain-containing protein [Lonepinella koalarum]|uniref:DUF2976 domain-containing protein n=1 Tax=Lonepinella koalarum TaxID=53417 RepID=UPI0011E49BCC|nr:DUF2976 domain-containing protein [Lonepinella koalarum]TYG35299.1 DUF2976 domain-containing protein [Lonepinella koalarum]
MNKLKSCCKTLSQYYFSAMLWLWGTMQQALADGPDATKIPDFKIPGVDSTTKDPIEIITIVAKSLVTLAAVLLAAGAIFVVVKALISIYNEATSENGRKGWGAFIIALIIGFVVIFFCLWLVKLAVGLF